MRKLHIAYEGQGWKAGTPFSKNAWDAIASYALPLFEAEKTLKPVPTYLWEGLGREYHHIKINDEIEMINFVNLHWVITCSEMRFNPYWQPKHLDAWIQHVEGYAENIGMSQRYLCRVTKKDLLDLKSEL